MIWYFFFPFQQNENFSLFVRWNSLHPLMSDEGRRREREKERKKLNMKHFNLHETMNNKKRAGILYFFYDSKLISMLAMFFFVHSEKSHHFTRNNIFPTILPPQSWSETVIRLSVNNIIQYLPIPLSSDQCLNCIAYWFKCQLEKILIYFDCLLSINFSHFCLFFPSAMK